MDWHMTQWVSKGSRMHTTPLKTESSTRYAFMEMRKCHSMDSTVIDSYPSISTYVHTHTHAHAHYK